MKAYQTITKEEYDNLIKDGVMYYDNKDYLDEYTKDFTGLEWLREQYVQRVQPSDEVKGVIYTFTKPESSEYLMADQVWAHLTLEIPDGQYLLIDHYASNIIYDNFFITVNEEECNQIYKQLESLSNTDPLKIEFLHQNWLRLFDKNFVADEEWYGKPVLVPYIHKIESSWITDVKFEQGEEWSQWLGPNKVNPEEYPPLEGYGDTLKIGDKFTWTAEGEIYTLLGWDNDDGFIGIYALNGEIKSNFFANPYGGDRVFKKVN